MRTADNYRFYLRNIKDIKIDLGEIFPSFMPIFGINNHRANVQSSEKC